MMNRVIFLLVLLTGSCFGYGQGFLGQTREQILQFAKDCDKEGNYEKMFAFKCGGRKLFFYFSDKDSTCDFCATDMEPKSAHELQEKLIAGGFRKLPNKYLEPYLISKHTNHQKFPSLVYAKGRVQYCFMPVSLNGKSTELNAVIARREKKE